MAVAKAIKEALACRIGQGDGYSTRWSSFAL